MQDINTITKLLRYYILLSSTTAGSGHPTSSLSATELMAVLYFKHFQYDTKNPDNLYNDRLIFSKGHATPLLYALYKVAGLITTDQLSAYRSNNSPLQGHPTPQTPYVDVASGSLGMGLSYGLGMALGLQKQQIYDPKVYVLLGDGEMAEGQIYEALQLASHYNINNLIGIIDVNRLAETGETMLGHDTKTYQQRIESFGWQTLVVDGHNPEQIESTLITAKSSTNPCMIIAQTIKGKGVSFLEDQLNKHGKALNQVEFQKAIAELDLPENLEQTWLLHQPQHSSSFPLKNPDLLTIECNAEEPLATRKAYGLTLAQATKHHRDMIVMDGDLSDSTFSGLVEKESPDQFLNMFIAEQNMVSAAVGLSKVGYKPFVSTFSAFMTRAYDQIRMASLSEANLVLCGSHGGVSVGEDGPSGMGLEDIAIMRAIYGSTILYPSDAYAMQKSVELAYAHKGLTYIRSTRLPTPQIYNNNQQFKIGGSQTLRSSSHDQVAIITAGITVHEALKAYDQLQQQGIFVRVIDCYSIKPIDKQTLFQASTECQQRLIVFEDHYIQGGLGDSVLEVFSGQSSELPLAQIIKVGVTIRPHSGKPYQNLEEQGLTADKIVEKVKSVV